jgi:cysteinyl-tRNA synthetase
VRPVELRYYLGQAHYRSAMEYSPEALAEAVAAYRGIEGFVLRANELVGGPAAAGPASPAAEELATVEDLAAAEDPAGGGDLAAVPAGPGTGAPPAHGGWPPEFAAALDDDLGVPQALAVAPAAGPAGRAVGQPRRRRRPARSYRRPGQGGARRAAGGP